ncbi:uncharacterized protein ColSpa_03497 [Colletotrichum spaethianum]|uniref:Uncharacterized protein n=1 Tax=Colletotrichum spaethianum TaxID=700344 RepID=A0AA37L792_9PEZI|nr:uncharacterized protein ColSpa_03497 [Colletotrichum spaethianum]GKT43316.1 hypothetical protein ColSpa_03497 [Colletotrichum spaethianum]
MGGAGYRAGKGEVGGCEAPPGSPRRMSDFEDFEDLKEKGVGTAAHWIKQGRDARALGSGRPRDFATR